MQEFHDAGILRVIQPAAFGGFEADFIYQIDLTYEIARSCGASGWVYAVLCAIPRARAAGGLGRRSVRARLQFAVVDRPLQAR